MLSLLRPISKLRMQFNNCLIVFFSITLDATVLYGTCLLETLFTLKRKACFLSYKTFNKYVTILFILMYVTDFILATPPLWIPT